MKIVTQLAISALVISLAGGAMAEEQGHRVMALQLHGVDSGDGSSFFLNSDELGFDLSELQVGETRSIVDEAGRAILITRGDKGFTFNIDGKVIEAPIAFDSGDDTMAWVSADGTSDIDVHVLQDFESAAFATDSGTMILTAEPIDDATQQAIRSVLESAGYDADVTFVDHEGSGDARVKIKKIERVVETS